MKVTIYDKNPGPGFDQWLLKLSWLLGCWFQKRIGAVDDYYGASSWADAMDWLVARNLPLESIQYWGHGSPGCVYLAQKNVDLVAFDVLKPRMSPTSLVWFRTCSTFQGARGHAFSGDLSNLLNCIVAGHTRIIGPLQGGLHTRRPGTPPSWPAEEVELPASWIPSWLRGGNNTVTCLATKVPTSW